MSDPHPWQEYNQYGNTCHHPGCTLAQDEHSGPEPAAKEFAARSGADVTPPLRNVAPDVPDLR